MPQLTIIISNNIDIDQLNFKNLFPALHDAIKNVPNMDITTCHSGIIQETYSYVGLGNEKLTKVYLELYWLETEERVAIKPKLAKKLMQILEEILVPQIEKQNLICIPRVRIANLGKLDQDYHISQRKK